MDMYSSDILDRAIIFAVLAHKNVRRKGKEIPYILHPLEASAIVATMTDDQELLAAAVLHDVIEDTPYTPGDVEKLFGKRVLAAVLADTQDEIEGLPGEESWHTRRYNSILKIKNADREGKIVAMGDKLSNMRAIARDYRSIGDEIWKLFTVKERAEHEWHYRALADALNELSDTEAYKEFVYLIDSVFGK